jgi:hypothetical protein
MANRIVAEWFPTVDHLPAVFEQCAMDVMVGTGDGEPLESERLESERLEAELAVVCGQLNQSRRGWWP